MPPQSEKVVRPGTTGGDPNSAAAARGPVYMLLSTHSFPCSGFLPPPLWFLGCRFLIPKITQLKIYRFLLLAYSASGIT